MWISYSDSEVNSFHPVCERALKYALKLHGLDKDYIAKHHQTTGSLEMDYVIQNVKTGKYLCVVEVKRTPADIHSARYQFQAMSYVQMNSGQNEKPFYILTNLEYAFSFRYDPARPRVFQQMLQPGITHVGDFSSYSEQKFIEKLSDFFAQRIDDFLNDRYDYLVTLEDFANHMEAIKFNNKRWKTHLAVLLYEYIRGAFNAVSRNELKDIRLFKNNVKRICNEAVRVNFKDIFTYSNSNFENTYSIDSSMLSDIYNFGEQNINGNTIAGILHSIILSGHEHEGEVPTDLDLARIVAVLAKHSSENLKNGGIVCDPAAGSGNLINEAIPEFNLNPTQILVNDINTKLLELLSMRIGLNYPKTISKQNSPQIYNKDIADMDKSIFSDVEVVVMNPPFCAGINSIDRRKKIYVKIKELTGHNPFTDIGQMPLEAVFLEMVLTLVKDGTTVACIFPKTHLVGRGPESQVIRRMLLNSFGLHTVFTYPGEDIFDDVMMDTCVLVGYVHKKIDQIKVISSYDRIPDIDIHKFYNSLSQNMATSFSQIMPGIVGKCVDYDELKNSLDDGWRILNSEIDEAITFVENRIKLNAKIKLLKDCDLSIKRGGAGNCGGSDLVFIDSRDDFMPLLKHLTINVASGMRNAVIDTIDIGSGDSKFFDMALNDDFTVNETIRIYNTLPARKGRQQRNSKTNGEWKKILRRESNGRFPQNSVLIPRGVRTIGKVYFSKNSVFVSTNFVVCSLSSYDDAVLMASWMSTIFYQLVCEVSSKDQEGMRKMEVADILKTYIPNKDQITINTMDRIKKEIKNIKFVELKNPMVREIDKIWAEELFGKDSTDILEEAKRLLSYLTNKRN